MRQRRFFPPSGPQSHAVQRAWQRISSLEGDPCVATEWHDTVFLHFAIDPERIRRLLPKEFELETHEGSACVSLAAVTMNRFRRLKASPLGLFLSLLPKQTFLNLRTYARWNDEPGAFFLRGWLSRPFGLRAPLGLFGLSATFARMEYRHEQPELLGLVRGRNGLEFRYQGTRDPQAAFGPCSPGSISEFALERYSGFFSRGDRPMIFRVWHPAWQQCPIHVRIIEQNLITEKFPWFSEAQFLEANLTKSIPDVYIGRPHGLGVVQKRREGRHHGPSAFYEIP